MTQRWLVEVRSQLFKVLRLDGDTYRIVNTGTDDAAARLEPFDATEFDVAAIWEVALPLCPLAFCPKDS